MAFKSVGEMNEVVVDGLCREMVDHVSFATGAGSFDEFAVPSFEEGHQVPFPCRSCPVQGAVSGHLRGEVQGFSLRGVCHQGFEDHRTGEAHLVDGPGLQAVCIFGDGILQVADGKVFPGDYPQEGLLDPGHLFIQPLSHLQRPGFQMHHPAGIFRGDPASSEGPSGGHGQVNAYVETGAFPEDVFEKINPFRGEKLHKLPFVPVNSIDGRDLQSAQPCGRILFHGQFQVDGIHTACHPPPAAPGFCFPGDFRPSGFRGFSLL